jgi:CheY-like chemotaxis protein
MRRKGLAGIRGGQGKQVVSLSPVSIMGKAKVKDDVIILIAEDDAGHSFLIRKNLERLGIGNDIIHFADGQELLDFFTAATAEDGHGAFDREARHVLLLDIRMPKLDGIEVLKRMAPMEHLRDIPVIMVTTTEDPIDVENSYGLGCSGYVTKPIDYEKLIEALEATGLFKHLRQ